MSPARAARLQRRPPSGVPEETLVAKKSAIRNRVGEAVSSAASPVPAEFAASEFKGEDSSVDLGLRLKRIRLDNGWTLEDVSQRTSVARSTLSKIENGQMSPTYEVLQRITRGTGLDIVELFDTRRQNAPFGRRSVTRRKQGKPHRTDTYRFELLATDLSQKQMLPFKAQVTARSLDDFGGWVRHQGEEFLCVLSGRVQVFTEFYSPVVLEEGDSTYFDSKMGHAIISLSEEDAEILWICTGAAPLE
jgi:transcriptional regulator with XRE-family HTH domain